LASRWIADVSVAPDLVGECCPSDRRLPSPGWRTVAPPLCTAPRPTQEAARPAPRCLVFRATGTSCRAPETQETPHVQSEARSPHAAELAAHLHRPAAAD